MKIRKVIKASDTVLFMSAPVKIKVVSYLDGGCMEKIPYRYEKEEGYEEIEANDQTSKKCIQVV